jgi:PAS domain S-box-containing protein
MAKTNHTLKLIIMVISIYFIGYLLDSLKLGNAMLRDYFQISTELLPLVLSFSIFIMSWFVYNTSKDNHTLFLGLSLFIIGLIDMYHILSYPFMPDFITPNSSHKAEIFWGEGKIISAVLILGSVRIYTNTLPWLKERSVLFASVFIVIISFLSLIFVGIFEENIPLLSNTDGSPTGEKIGLILISSMIILYACYLYLIRLRKTGENNLICLLYGFFLLFSSNIVYLFLDYPGHLIKAAGFYFMYLGLFKSSVEQPYLKLAEAGEKRCHEVEEKFHSLFDNAIDAIIITDLENRVTSWNKSAERMFGWTENEIIGKNFMPLAFDQKLQVENEQIIRNAISGSTFSDIETILSRKDGIKIDVSMTVSPLRDTNQNVVGLSGIFRDITERKHAEEQIKASLREKEVLLREIHHRVKNNMQIISSLLRLQSASIKDKEYSDMYLESQNRIMSMSLIHEKLYRSRDLTKIDIREYVENLVDSLFESFGVNAAKITFPDDRTGEIRIQIRSIDVDDIELTVSDNGTGIRENLDIRKTESWGMRLVVLLAENQLQGGIVLNRSKGTEFQIRFKDVN